MKIELEDAEKQFVLELIEPALVALVGSLVHRNDLDATEENYDAVTDAVCDFLVMYYGK